MVLIVGGGNSAFETADYLSGKAGIVHVAFNRRIQFAWDTHYVGEGLYFYSYWCLCFEITLAPECQSISLFYIAGDLRAVNNNILDMYHLKSLHSTIASHVVKIVKKENGKFVATFRDLNTHWAVPGWLYFDMEYDHVISCMGWRYVNIDMLDDTINIGKKTQTIQSP